MKKVININFSGRLISIEEDAYAQLQNYMESLKQYFSNEEGKEEIIADIENRIAEIFNDKLKAGVASISETEVNEVINIIGKPEDFEPVEESKTEHTRSTAEPRQFVTKGKLYRNGNDKMLGGVCSGIAAYFNIDTVLVRVLFAVLLFGAGVGFLLYIILWIVIPESTEVQTSMEKRLYRNPDDKMLGGVASGLSKYFGIDVWIPRLIFAAPLIFALIRGISVIAYHNFFTDNRFWTFSFGGTTTVIYFLLWWIIPEAKTVQQKMAMKGEKMDLNSIKTNVQDGIKNFADKAQVWGKDISSKSTEFARNLQERAQAGSARVNTVTRSTSSKIGHGIGLLIKGFALFIGGIIAFSLLMALFGLIFGAFSLWPLKAFLLEGNWQNAFAWGSLLFLAIPGIAFLTWLIRRICKIKTNIKPVKAALAILFFTGLVSVIFLVSSLLNSFKGSNFKNAATEMAMTQPKDKIILKVSEPEIAYSGEFPWINMEGEGFDITSDTLKYANIKITIEKSDDSLFHTKIKKYSRGLNAKDAEDRAQRIAFHYTQKDSILDLGSNIAIGRNEKFRGQELILILQVPEGKKVRFDASIEEKLHPFNVRISETWINGRRVQRKMQDRYNDFDYFFDYQVNQDYYMTADGKLELVNKPKESTVQKTEEINDSKKEAEKEKERLRLEKEQQENEKKIEELQRKNDKLEEKKNATTGLLLKEDMRLQNPLSFACINFTL
jgi:phage shock protein PspC (stress-responsive transcriptional regulator)